MAMFVMLAGQRAEACPQGTMCVSAETRSQVRIAYAAVEDRGDSARGHEVSRDPRPRSMLQVALARQDMIPVSRLTASLRTHRVPRVQAVEMPWVWVQLRRSVYAKMPRYDRVARRPENRFSLVLSPVVVESPHDTVPGVGVEGGF